MHDVTQPVAPPEIVDLLAAYVAAYGSGSLDALRPFYSSGTLVWPNMRGTVLGWEEVRAMFAPSFERYIIGARVHLQEVRGGGDERFLRFLTEVHLAPRDGGEPVIAAFRDFAVFQRVEGRWTILRNIDQPISPEQLAADLLRDPPLAVIGNPAN
jgi:ketosteroid isomerase-like protein